MFDYNHGNVAFANGYTVNVYPIMRIFPFGWSVKTAMSGAEREFYQNSVRPSKNVKEPRFGVKLNVVNPSLAFNNTAITFCSGQRHCQYLFLLLLFLYVVLFWLIWLKK